MPSSHIPPLDSLQRPEKLTKALKEDTGDDCLSCRLVGRYKTSRISHNHLLLHILMERLVVGATALIGLGGYSYFSGKYQLQQQETAILRSGSRFGMQSRRMGLVGIAGSLIGLGLWRLVN